MATESRLAAVREWFCRLVNKFAKKRIFNAKAGTRSGKRYGKYYRSSWEYNFSLILDEWQRRGEIFSWDYERVEFWFPVKRGTRSYKPDFRVFSEEGGGALFYEIKGFLDKKSATALDRMARYHPEVKVLIVGKKEYNQYVSEYGELPGWEK